MERALAKFVRKMPGERLTPAEGPATVCGAFVETDDLTGRSRAPDRSGPGRRPSCPIPMPEVVARRPVLA